jgi:hypothetical protein
MPMLTPPAQYDHPPKIPVIERVVPWNELQQFCRAGIEAQKVRTATGYGVWGCSVVKDGKCYIARIDNPGVRSRAGALQWLAEGSSRRLV